MAPVRASCNGPPEKGLLRVDLTSVPTLRASTALGFGALALREEPLLRVPQDNLKGFLSSSAPEIFAELAVRLGDEQRLGVFAAFLLLSEGKQQVLLGMGLPPGSQVLEANEKAIAAFLRDFPTYSGALDWQLFARVVAIVSERGTRLPSEQGGCHVVYEHSDLASHSCCPNAVVETLSDDGLRELRVLSYEGIAENEEVTVSYVPEELLLQPLPDRSRGISELRQGYLCRCPRCKLSDEMPNLTEVSKDLKLDLALEDLQQRLHKLKQVDVALPFAMASKARVRFRLAQACERPLPSEAKKLYEDAFDETDIVLGQKGLRNVSNIKRRLEQLDT
ncbi:Phosphoglycolate phosphatase [Durusdinium trenchii]|uniref:Phosphoglycolate phosphatase n=1 Tax=Durusdinium trenchii TaxID=1381693 RepID=A0ABP0PAV0_9DINO